MTMEGIPVSAAMGALNSVLEKLATLVVDEYKLCKVMGSEIKLLTDELTFMHAFLLKMTEVEDPDVQDMVWMTAVRELSYDIEDSIDDFMQDEDAKPDGFIKKMMHMMGMWGKRKRHHQMFLDLKKRAIEVGERSERYKTRQVFSNTKNGTVDPRALAIFEHASKLVGIDEPKAELIKLLTEENGCASTQVQPKMVSIVGSGGLGKTTLANLVYQELKEKFKCKAFVSVSRNPDMTNILRTILSEVSCQGYAHTEAGSIQQLISKISDYLVDKR
ncbi:unnamed protein product [Triticum turgidum subsp. durum]|nr:unnamed protein product [Triticum turgidum subsp. durum]